MLVVVQQQAVQPELLLLVVMFGAGRPDMEPSDANLFSRRL